MKNLTLQSFNDLAIKVISLLLLLYFSKTYTSCTQSTIFTYLKIKKFNSLLIYLFIYLFISGLFSVDFDEFCLDIIQRVGINFYEKFKQKEIEKRTE